jgi:hypothetical protein
LTVIIFPFGDVGVVVVGSAFGSLAPGTVTLIVLRRLVGSPHVWASPIRHPRFVPSSGCPFGVASRFWFRSRFNHRFYFPAAARAQVTGTQSTPAT